MMGTNFIRAMLLASVSVTAAVGVAPASARAQEQSYDINIPAQSLGDAIRALGRTTRQTIVFDGATVRGKRSVAVRGNMTTAEALDRMLSGSGLVMAKGSSGSLTVRLGNGQGGAELASSNGRGSLAAGEAPAGSPAADHESAEDQEIVVTGTNIRNSAPVGSPITVIRREDIDRSGYASTRDLILSLPQVSGGGINENTGNVLSTGSATNGYAASANLRGFGSNATLVLFDGHRLAPAGIGGSVDISAIPLSAISRVEVLTDGASAIYGSDAVAGVVNFISRQDFSGAETDIQYGISDSGDVPEWRASQTVGLSWGSGNFGLTGEHYDRDALLAGDRRITRGVPPSQYITPDQDRTSVLVYGRQEIAPEAELSARVLYSDQNKFIADITNANTPFTSDYDNTLLSISGNFEFPIIGNFKARISGIFGKNQIQQTTFQPRTNVERTTITENESEGLEANINGSLLSLPAGDVRIAVGAAVRWEHFDLAAITGSFNADRRVLSIYGETVIPLLADSAGEPRLEFSAAVRHEDYGSIGSTTNPKFGINFSPAHGLRLRGTWGTSFHAPEFNDLFAPNRAIVFRLADPTSPTGTTLSVIGFGGSPSLRPETSETLTVGFDWSTSIIPNLRISSTYFNIRYDDQLAVACVNAITAFTNPAACGAVERNPSIDSITAFLAAPTTVQNLAGAFSVDDVRAFVDGRKLNVSRSRQEGFDASITNSATIGTVNLVSNLMVTHLFRYSRRLSPTSPEITVVDRLFLTPDWRVRAGVTAQSGGASGSVFLNYTDSYIDDSVITAPYRVDSFTTLDVQAAIDFSESSMQLLSGVRLSLSIRNILNTRPPQIRNTNGFFNGIGYGFDPANADPIGRSASVRVTFRW